ncbi:MAG: type III-B CRISPR module RAMP protein Cmr6 [Deltaproteobacteria bacterium]|nr:type III-B CRISPR module RAMP protein Cmr6 [Deltaproteobacteria bacterium]
MDTLPSLVRAAIAAEKEGSHPGLRLDKHAIPTDQQQQSNELDSVCAVWKRTRGDASYRAEFEGLRVRRGEMLKQRGARAFGLALRTPLTMHLARASSLENVGIALHRVYGFPYLPATGVKGVARAFAILSGAEADALERVFGTSAEDGEAGAVVFHEGWPEELPELVTEVATNHHRSYYDGRGAPGDWEDPVPLTFLAVEAGVRFGFGVHARHPGVPSSDLDLAAGWLRGGLCHLGAGAKTGTGYGWFAPDELTPRSPRETLEYQLTLVTPAFLAGRAQQQRDCTLHGATVKGLLRWWWRTMHVGWLSSSELLELEGVLFGDTVAGLGLIEVGIVALPGGTRPEKAPYKKEGQGGKLELNDSFVTRHDLKRGKTGLLPLAYAGYGMADGRNHRYVAEAGHAWRLTLRVRSHGTRPGLTLDAVRAQAEAALWLLCNHGAVGAKGRKGFGSLRVPAEFSGLTLDKVRGRGASLRETLHLGREFSPGDAGGAPSLGAVAGSFELDLPWTNPWQVMNVVGAALQGVASEWKHLGRKVVLGLPRKIHGPGDRPMRHQNIADYEPPQNLRGLPPAQDRHASPVHVSLDDSGGRMKVRALAFVADKLDATRSGDVLREYLELLRSEVEREARSAPKGPPQPMKQPSTGPQGKVTLVLTEFKNNFWQATLPEYPGWTGVINNSNALSKPTRDQRIEGWVQNVDAPKKIVKVRFQP